MWFWDRGALLPVCRLRSLLQALLGGFAMALIPRQQQGCAGCSLALVDSRDVGATMDKASAGFGAGSQQDHPKHFFLSVGHVLFLHPFHFTPYCIFRLKIQNVGSCKQTKTSLRLLCQREPDFAHTGVSARATTGCLG